MKANFIIQTKDTSKLRGKCSVMLFTSSTLQKILKKTQSVNFHNDQPSSVNKLLLTIAAMSSIKWVKCKYQ